jgi:hypothetical protein
LNDERKCPKCNFPCIGDALGPTGARIEAAGYCSNCGSALDGSDRRMTAKEMFWMKFAPSEAQDT